jgi:hypothetical protein
MSREDAIRFMTLVDLFSASPATNPQFESEATRVYEAEDDVHLYGLPKMIEFIGEANRPIVLKVLELLGIGSSKPAPELKQRSTADLFKLLADQSPELTVEDTIEYLIEDAVPKGVLLMVTGKPSQGKSTLVFHWA